MKRRVNSSFQWFLFLVLALWVAGACQQAKVPKPKGYFRIDFPQHEYQPYSSLGCPFTFEYPNYAAIIIDSSITPQPCWLDIYYPEYHARVHLSYLPIKQSGQLENLLDEARKLAFSHSQKATGIREESFDVRSHQVYGTWYEIHGDVASALQFVATDSTKHYFRGALYFDESSRRDSIQPVIDFIAKDMRHLLSTLRWQ